MAPKKGKGKSTAGSSSRFNTDRFKDVESAESFQSRFINRTVIFERIVVHRGLVNTEFMAWLRFNRLLNLSNLINECFEDWVREFYCNMFDVIEIEFKTYVRGKTLTVNADKIANLLDIARPLRRVYPLVAGDNIEIIANEVATALCGAPTVWNNPIMKISTLTTDYGLLNTFVCHNIEPRGHKSDLQYLQAFFLYSLGGGNGVDVPQTIFESMLRIYTEPRQLTLAFGAIICRMMIEAGCQAYSHELPVPNSKRQKIDTRTMSMSDTHVRRQVQGEQAQVQGEHGQVQADDAEADSIENHLSAVEYAVSDQSIQIEQLEERVATGFEQLEERVAIGFQDMRNQLNEMFNHIRRQ